MSPLLLQILKFHKTLTDGRPRINALPAPKSVLGVPLR
jgi:hypothetical protein